MKWLDAPIAWLLVLLGAAHLLAAWIPRLSLLRGPWAAGTAVAVLCVGLMNAVRAQRKSDAFLRWSTALATAVTAGLCMVRLYQFSGNVLHQPVALATSVAAIIELFFAVAG